MAPNLAEMLIRWSMTLIHFLLRNFKMAAKTIFLLYWVKFQTFENIFLQLPFTKGQVTEVLPSDLASVILSVKLLHFNLLQATEPIVTKRGRMVLL